MILLLGLLCVLWGEQGLCLQHHGGFLFDGDIRHFAVATSGVYVATDTKLYQLSHDLTLVRSQTQRGILKKADQPENEQFYRVSETAEGNATFRVNMLLPFEKNNSVFSCGMTDNQCGYCEVLDLHNISKLLYSEHIQVGPLRNSSGSVGFLVDLKKNPTKSETYILTAIQQHKDGPEKGRCSSDSQAINLQDAQQNRVEGIFSLADIGGTAVIKSKRDVNFVDGFQIGSVIYLLSNVLTEGRSNRVRLLWFDEKTKKTDTLKSVRGATLRASDGAGEGSRLLASSVIPGEQPVLWSGVFSVDGGESNTELVVFDISPDVSGQSDADPDFFFSESSQTKVTPKTLKPKAVIFKKNYMTSVLAVRQKAWMVFFIGTADGQLIKLAVDRNYHTTCPMVLYSVDDDRKVFPRIHLDQVDHKHVYVPFRNQMERVAVAKCSTYKNMQECWSAQDPHCVWCVSKTSCTFEDDCKDSDWLSIPDDSQQKMVSHNVVMDSSGQIALKIQTHLTVGQNPSNFACQFSATSRELCRRNNPPPQFPQCTCILSSGMLPANAGLHVTVKIRLGKTQLSEQLKITNCSGISGPPSSFLCQQCIKAGCGWSKSGCSWDDEGVGNDSICQKVDSGRNFSRPEISSITPSVVSFYGRNHAMLSGHNLGEVTGVRIQGHLHCTPQESPVWNNTGVNLTFHIPSTGNKGVVKVCVLLSDGSCHGNAEITYQSSPACTNIAPNSTWISGKRNITLMGSHLEFVEEVVHSHALQEVRLPINGSHQNLTYDSPAAENNPGISSSTVLLKVANQTLNCTKITYYPEPEFTKFTSTRTGDDVRITIEKKADKLEITEAELLVWGVRDGKEYPCNVESKETSNGTDFFTCEIKDTPNAEFQQLLIKYGDKIVTLGPESSSLFLLMLLVLLLIPCIIVVVVIIYRSQQRKLTAKMNDLELDISNDI